MNQLHLFEDPEATSFKNFSIYRSSAGSGKTFTLVKEYLKIVLRNPQDYKHILAITFTNKATGEMKDRILKSLMKMANGIDSDMQKIIEDEVKHYQQQLNIQDRAQKALTNILHDYSRFSVSTIDHFFSQLVRSLARELKLNLNYEIDVDDDTAMRESLNLLYENLSDNLRLRDWVKDFAFSQIEEDKGWQLDYTLIKFGKELFKEKFHKGFSQIDPQQVNLESLRELEHQLQLTRENYQNQQRDLAGKALNIIADHGLKSYDFKHKGSGTVSVFYNFFKGKFEFGKRFLDVAQGYDDWFKEDSPKRDTIEVAAVDLNQVVKEIFTYHQKHYSEYVSAVQLQRHVYSYGLLDALEEHLRAYRQSNNLMLLSHNSFLLKEIISDQEAPFLFEKLGSYYRHIMIDEFQDTSAYQWDNLKPLITNSLDGLNHVLLVGDVKQSVYRWRGGDLNLLLQKAVHSLSLYTNQLREESLNVNRRSAQSVVSFNNQFFKYASELLIATSGLPENTSMLKQVYQEVEQQTESKISGCVKVQFFERNRLQWREDALNYTTKVIEDHLAQLGRYSDILILCYKNMEVAEISQHLSELGMPVSSDQALSLAGNWSVRLIISAMYLLKDPEDQLARAEMAFLFQKGNFVDKVDYHQLFAESGQISSGLLEQYLPVALCNQWNDLSSKNIYEWVSSVIPLLIVSDEPDPFLTRFMEVCLEQHNKGRETVNEFLEWWSKNKQDQMVIFPGGREAITIMTIHKAKGLEAPIVLLPWADFELKPRSDSLFWTDKLSGQYQKYKLLPLSFTDTLLDSQFAEAYQQELLEGLIEGLNTVYVAFTRARQRLYVSSVVPTKAKEDELTRLYKLLWVVCERFEPYWDSQKMSFTMGDFSEPIKRIEDESKAAIPINRIRLSSYNDKVVFQSAQQRMFTLLDNYKANAIREGIQIHTVLERIGHKEDIPVVLDKMLAEGLIRDEDKPTIHTEIDRLFQLPEFLDFFDPKWQVFSEREIGAEGRKYKPDRVLVSDNRTLVVDFKREKEQAKHHSQLELYASLLEKMGYSNIEKYLVYVMESKVIRI